jgi:hypothetical protein
MRENQNQHNETFYAERETIRERELAAQTVYQIIEIGLTGDPPTVRSLGTAYPTRTEAVQELERFLWEEVGQQNGTYPDNENWLSEISLMKTRDDHGEMIFCDFDAQFQWQVIKVEIAQ